MTGMRQQTCPLTVNYDAPIKEVIGAGKFRFVSKRIFRTSFRSSQTGKASLEGVLINFHAAPRLTLIEVLETLASEGLRPAEFVELLAFGESHLDTAGKPMVVALGSIGYAHRKDPELYVPLIERTHPEACPSLKVQDAATQWGRFHWFLAFRK